MSNLPTLRRGFTLVEMLVVLAILLLLAAILFPVFQSVRNGARTSTCASNLSQISKAVSMYVEDHNQRYPPVKQAQGCTWVDTIYPYTKSTDIFTCPQNPEEKYVTGCMLADVTDPGNPTDLNGFNGGYDMVTPYVHAESTVVTGGSTTSYFIEDKAMSVVRYRYPSSTIFALDGRDGTYLFHTDNAVVNPGIDPIHSVDDLKDGGVLPVHGNGVNLLYVDGHVKWQKLEALASTPMWRPDGREPTDAPTPTP